MFFASDNAGPVAPEIMAALAGANTGHALAYGNDRWLADARARVREVFEAPEAAVYLVAGGTAANALALSTLAPAWSTIFCTPVAHIWGDECNAPEFFSGGARVRTVGESDRMEPAALASALAQLTDADPHSPQRGPVSLTQVTERGTVYSLDRIKALTAVAHRHGAPVHMDGARLANAFASLGCTPAEMTWRAGIDALSFGATKNGCMGLEAVIFFDPRHAWEFELRRMRAGHLLSKHRYLSAQMLGYLEDGLWLRLAAAANSRAAYLARGLEQAPGVRITHEVSANMIFAEMPRGLHRRLRAAGAVYALMGDLDGPDEDEPIGCRLVCDFSLPEAEIDRFLTLLV